MGSFRWEDHSIDLTRLITELYENVEFTDCELDSDGGLLKAHRVILAACSPYFKDLLIDHNKMISIPVKEIKYSDMKYILDFMYYGEVDVPVVDVASFMKAAQFFQVASFKRYDSNFTDNFSCSHNCEIHLSNNSTLSEANFINHQEEEFNELRSIGASEQEDGVSVKYKTTDLQTICVAVEEVVDVTKHLSEVGNSLKDEASILKSSMIKKEIMDEDGENLQDLLNPISFVAVSPFSEKVAEHDDERIMCSDTELKNPLEEYSYDCDVTQDRIVKMEKDLKTEPRMQMDYEEEMNACELLFPNTQDMSTPLVQKNNTDSDNISFCDIKISFDELSLKIEENSVIASELTSGETNNFVERSADLEVKFESICDISEHEIKEEKFCENMILQNTVQLKNAPPTLKVLKEELVPDDSTDMDDHEEIASPMTSRINLMDANLMNLSEVECGNENSALPKNRDSSRIRSIPSKEKVTLKKKSFNSSQCDGAFSSETKDDLLPSHKVHLCSSKLASENGLRQRVPTPCAGLKNISCSICEVSFTQKGSLKRHMRRIHTDQKKFPCSICQEAFNRRCLLQVHMLTHAGERPFLCEFCGASFDRENKMKKHVRYHFGWRPYPCEICKKAFRMKSHLNEHMQIHTGEKPFSCEICKVSYARKYVLKQHMRIHTGDRRFKCGICNASFERRETLRKHFPKHTGEKNFSCGICKESFACGENLKAHMPIHRDRKRFSCDTCKMSFPRKVNFKKHMRTHSVVKPYSCGICKLCFLRNYELTKHMRTHTGEKPFLCEICDTSFAHRGHLTRHILTHSGERPFSCEICDTSFARKDRLKTHMRTHTAEKQFLCVICKGTFNGKTHLNEHLRTHTTEKLFSY